jgi:uncharacterized protein YjbI with pentapeptide repeats
VSEVPISAGHGSTTFSVLVEASLRSADLREANVELADVTGEDFTGSNLEDARFYGATWDDSTVWPDGFRPG